MISDIRSTHPGLDKLLSVFLEENSKINLSALRTKDACDIGNIQDSLALAEVVDQNILPKPSRMIDIGTGGGFPLLPLAIVWPDTTCVGLDSTTKKIEAIKRIASAIPCSNVECIADRAETIGHVSQHRAQYDITTSRAVAPIATLLEYCTPLTRVGGHIVLWKSLHVDEELAEAEAAIKIFKLTLIDLFVYELEGDFGKRQLLIFKKDAGTPAKYPREVGLPKKMPIV